MMKNEHRARRIFNISLVLTLVLAFLFGFQIRGVFQLLEEHNRLPQWLSKASSVISYGLHANPQGFTDRDLWVFNDVLAYISANYLYRDDIVTENIVHGAAMGAVAALGDRYSRFIPPPDQEILTEEIEGSYAGVGISIIDRPGVLPHYALDCEIENGADEYDPAFYGETRGVVVVQVFETGPAYESGLKTDDVILCVDGANLRGGVADDAVAVIKGPEDTQVTITIWRGSIQTTETFEVTRKVVQVPTVGAVEMLDDKIGYIRLDSFNNFSPVDVREAANELRFQGMEGLIFDLRNNTGGPMTAAQHIADIFISDGVMVYYEDSSGHREELRSEDNGDALNIPLIVLVNRNSASASEIVAGAVRDTHMGILLGETTFGKGVVQNVYTLRDGSGLILTTGHYLTPDRHEITADGIVPDIEYTLEPEALRELDPEVGVFLDRLEELNIEFLELRNAMYEYMQEHDYQRNSAQEIMAEWLATGEPPDILDDPDSDDFDEKTSDE